MSFNVGGSSGQSTSQSQIPAWLQGDWENGLLSKAQQVSSIPYQDYLGSAGTSFLQGDASNVDRLVAPLNSLQNLGAATAVGNSGAGISTANNAASLANLIGTAAAPQMSASSANYQGYDPSLSSYQTYQAKNSKAPDSSVFTYSTVNQPKFNQATLAQYMNPYTQSVIDSSMNDLDRSRQITNAQTNSALTTSGGEGAWNGSAAGVERSLNDEAYMRSVGSLSSTLNDQNYSQAMGAAQNYDAMGEQAQEANQAASLQKSATVYGGDLQTALANAAATNAARQFDAGAYNTSSLFNANAKNTASEFDANAYNTNSMFNATNSQQASLQNLQAQLQQEGYGLSAASELGSLAGVQQSLGQAQASDISGAGNTYQQQSQAQLNALESQFQTASGYPQQQLASLAVPFGMYPTTATGGTKTTNSSGKSAGVGNG